MTGNKSTLARGGVVAVAVLVVVGLGAGPVASLTGPLAHDAQDTDNASVRVAHMSADAPAVEVRVDDETVIQNLEYGDVTDYLDLQAGEHQVAIVTAENETTVFEGQVSVEANERYTLVAAGQVSENATEEFQLLALQDVRSAPTGNDTAVRLVHVSPDLGPVDVTLNRTGEVLFDNATFGNATEYATVRSGVYTLNVREATADNDGAILATFTESFLDRTAYSAFAAPEDEQPDEPIALFVAIDQSDNTEIPGVTTQADNATTAETDSETTAEADGETTTEA